LCFSASLAVNIIDRKRSSLLVHNCRLSHMSLCLSVCPESVSWKTADWIRVPFGVVSGVGRGMGVLDGSGGR